MSIGSLSRVQPSVGVVSDEVQEIRMTESERGYTPDIFHIKPNRKTRWIIIATNPYSCASQLVASVIGVRKQLTPGENVIEFISPASGTIGFSCSMGMYSGKIIIDRDDSNPDISSPSNTINTSDSYSCSAVPEEKK